MWKDNYLETRILTASPLELVNILYEYSIRSVRDARRHLAARDIPSRTTAVCKAISLITELRSSLNHEVGGEMSAKLESLYRYMQTRLTDGNMKQQDEPLAEVESLLENLANAWGEIALNSQPETSPAEPAQPAVEISPAAWNMPFAAQPDFEPAASYWSA
jgi:flagellar protein FliS